MRCSFLQGQFAPIRGNYSPEFRLLVSQSLCKSNINTCIIIRIVLVGEGLTEGKLLHLAI